jgi:3-phosphoshikimate 1-carboxyvinyltransferase
MSHTYPPELPIEPLAKPVSATVTVPGSKSITNRALVLAALASPGCTVLGALRSEDTEVMVDCLQRLGFAVTTDWSKHTIDVFRNTSVEMIADDEWIPKGQADLFVGNSGTTIRFLTAMLALGEGSYRLDGIPRMRERPIGDLLDALKQLGVDARSEFENGCPPVIVNANGLHGGHVRVRAAVSSQFLSALMLVCPFARGDTIIEIDGPLVSEPYIEMTIAVLQSFGLKISAEGPRRYLIPGRQDHGLSSYVV